MSPLGRISWLRWWWPALAWAAVISTFSTDAFSADNTSRIFVPLIHWLFPAMSAVTLDLLHHYVRKSAHVSEFFILSLILVRAIRGGRSGWKLSWAVAAVALASGCAALDELHQAFVPSRGPSMMDVLIDVSGAMAAQILYAVAAWLRPRCASSAGQAQQAVLDANEGPSSAEKE